jgi:RNA polymerase sigma factor (sigma-70 family)
VSNGEMHLEENLVKKVISGDIRAFKDLVHQHERLVTYMVSRIVSDQEEINDISQEVFIKVYQSINRFNYDSKLSTWIAKIAYRTAINYARKDLSKNVLNEAEVPINYETPEHILSIKNEAEFIQRQIGRLPLSYRTVVTLYHLNEFSYQEIGDITGFPEGTVKNYLFRARKLLKERLEHYYKARK